MVVAVEPFNMLMSSEGMIPSKQEELRLLEAIRLRHTHTQKGNKKPPRK